MCVCVCVHIVPAVHMEQGLVAHEQGASKLQGWDLQREVEGGDQADRAKGEPVAVAVLARVVPGNAGRPGCEAYLHSAINVMTPQPQPTETFLFF